MESKYEDITGGPLSVCAISTEDKLAYGSKHTQSSPQVELIYDDVTKISMISTHDNPAYSHAQTLTTTVQAEATIETL